MNSFVCRQLCYANVVVGDDYGGLADESAAITKPEYCRGRAGATEMRKDPGTMVSASSRSMGTARASSKRGERAGMA